MKITGVRGWLKWLALYLLASVIGGGGAAAVGSTAYQSTTLAIFASMIGIAVWRRMRRDDAAEALARQDAERAARPELPAVQS